jgi:hypothetical protein
MDTLITILHPYFNTGTFNPAITLHNISGYQNVINGTQIGIFFCDSISGRIYDDNNSNCIYDGGDFPIVNCLVRLSDSANYINYAITDTVMS